MALENKTARAKNPEDPPKSKIGFIAFKYKFLHSFPVPGNATEIEITKKSKITSMDEFIELECQTFLDMFLRMNCDPGLTKEAIAAIKIALESCCLK